MTTTTMTRTRWAAVGAAVAVALGAGGIGIGHATTSSGERPVYVPIEPCRIADTRPAPNTVGPRPTPLGPADVHTIEGWGQVGNCDLPTGTSGLALNVTAVGASQQTNLRFFPAGTQVPETANLNPTPGAPPTPNAVNVSLNDEGKFSVFNKFGSVAVVIDVVGVYDDHHHDDRYYTENEVDAALADKADAATTYTKTEVDVEVAAVDDRLLGAVVDSTGVLVRGYGATSAARIGPGNFRAFFDRDISQCVYNATPAQPGNSGTARDTIVGVALLSTDSTGLYVSVESEAGVDKDQGFHVIVLC